MQLEGQDAAAGAPVLNMQRGHVGGGEAQDSPNSLQKDVGSCCSNLGHFVIEGFDESLLQQQLCLVWLATHACDIQISDAARSGQFGPVLQQSNARAEKP